MRSGVCKSRVIKNQNGLQYESKQAVARYARDDDTSCQRLSPWLIILYYYRTYNTVYFHLTALLSLFANSQV